MNARTNQTPALKSSAKVKPKTRRRGRPPKDDPGLLNKETILSLALQMTKSVSLPDLSVVRVASELGVTPALIHYYIGSRDGLTSGVMNAFYREVVENWPAELGDWAQDFEVLAHSIYRAYLRYPGVVIYVATHNRYQLFQDVGEGEADYGLLTFEKFIAVMRKMGMDPGRTGMYAHLSMAFISSFAHMTVTHRWPGQSREFLVDKMGGLDPVAYPNIAFVRDSFTNLGATDAFMVGMRMLMESLEAERKRFGETPPPAKKVTRKQAKVVDLTPADTNAK